MRPSRTPTSAVVAGAPVPSTTRAPWISRSSIVLLPSTVRRAPHLRRRYRRRSRDCRGVEAHRVGVHELAEIGVAEEVVLDHLVHLAEHVGHDRHVPVRDVGTEHGVEARAERIGLGVEGGDRHRVVGLAPAVERRREQVADLFGVLDADGGEFVEECDVLLGIGRGLRRHPGPVAAVAREQVGELVPVDVGGVEATHGRAAALLEVPDEIGVERRRPRHAALEETEVEVGEAASDTTEEQRLGERVVALAEHADVVVHVARDGRPVLPAHGRRVERGCDAELPALLPDRVVVVRAVESEGVGPHRVLRELRVDGRDRVDRPLHEPGHHDGAEAERRRVLELVDGFLGSVHRDLGHRQQAVGELGEDAGVEAVERAARAPAVALVVEVAEQQSEAGVDHADVDAELGQTLVQEPGEHGGGAVDRELHAAVAPRAAGDAAVGALLGRQRVPVDDRAEGAGGAAQHRLAVEPHPFLHQLAGEGGEELDGVAVDVDHRVVEPAPYLARGQTAHVRLPVHLVCAD